MAMTAAQEYGHFRGRGTKDVVLGSTSLRILALIRDGNRRGVPPTIRELSAAVGIQLRAIHGHLLRLRRLGLVAWGEGAGRPALCGRRAN